MCGAEVALFRLEGDSPAGAVELIWAHGWGHTHQNMLPLAQAMRRSARSILIDFPGFGASPLPPGPWGTADYADAMAEWLGGLPPARRIWIGHSFGCRVGLQLAARHPEILAGLRHLRYQKHEVVVFHTLDAAELDFPFRHTTLFRGLEGLPEILTDPPGVRDSWTSVLASRPECSGNVPTAVPARSTA